MEFDAKQNMSLVAQTVPTAPEGEAAPEPLQVWVSVPSFYAEVISDDKEAAEGEILLSGAPARVSFARNMTPFDSARMNQWKS